MSKWLTAGIVALIAVGLGVAYLFWHSSSAKDEARWQSPRYLNLEVYLLRRGQLSLSPSSQGCTGHPDLRAVTQDAHPKFRYTCGNSGELPYEVEIEYLKRSADGNDSYLVQCTIPVSPTTSRHTTEVITYSGKNLELFRDNRYVLGLRPANQP